MNWLSLLIGLLIGWIAEWIVDVFYWRRRAGGGAGSGLRGGQTAAQPDAGRPAVELRQEAEDRRLLQQSQAAGQASEIVALRAQLAAQADLERRLAECEGVVGSQRARLTAQLDLERRLTDCQGELESQRARLESASSELAAVRAAQAIDLQAPPEAAAGAGLAAAGSTAQAPGPTDLQPPAEAAPAADFGAAAQTHPASRGVDLQASPTDAPAAELAAAAPTDVALGVTAGEAAATPASEDDLVIIEGIGPKIAGLLKEAGIRTFAGLAAAEVPALQAILTAAGPRFRMANPATWPAQASLAAACKWDELQALQARLSAGLSEHGQ